MKRFNMTDKRFLRQLRAAQLRAIRDGRLKAADGFAVAIAKLKKRMDGASK